VSLGPGHDSRGAGGRRPAGEVPRARGGRGLGAVGTSRRGHTYAFDETVAWLATQSSKSTVTELMRIAWRTVGSIITRVWDDVDANCDRLAGLRRIGIDEISYKKGHKYLMVVVDHDTRRMVWARASLLWLTPSRRHGRSRCRSRRWSRSLGWRSTGLPVHTFPLHGPSAHPKRSSSTAADLSVRRCSTGRAAGSVGCRPLGPTARTACTPRPRTQSSTRT
jgi:hypothetical protein